MLHVEGKAADNEHRFVYSSMISLSPRSESYSTDSSVATKASARSATLADGRPPDAPLALAPPGCSAAAPALKDEEDDVIVPSRRLEEENVKSATTND